MNLHLTMQRCLYLRAATRRLLLALPAILLAAGRGAAAPAADYVLRLDLRADIRALGGDDPFISESSAERLVALGEPVLPILAAALAREDASTRAGVIDVLRQIPGREAAVLLRRAAHDPDPAVRADALMALGLRGESAGAGEVAAALADRDPRARRAAALACSSLCATPAALSRLVDLAVGDPDGAAALASLETIVADERRRPAAIAAIEAGALPLLVLGERADGDHLQAALTVALIGRAEAVPPLAAALAPGGPHGRAVRAALALGRIPDPAAVAALAQATDDPDSGVRAAACVGLSQMDRGGGAGAAAARTRCPTAPPPTASTPRAMPSPQETR